METLAPVERENVAWLPRQGQPSRYPVAVSLAFLAAVLLLCFAMDRWHPSISASLSSAGLAPGTPLSMSDLHPTGRPPIEVDSGNFSIAQMPAPARRGASAHAEELVLLLPVSRHGCQRLRDAFGGGCGTGAPSAGRPVDGIEISPARPRQAVSVQFEPRENASMRVTQSTTASQQPIPTAWAVQFDAPRTDVPFDCSLRTVVLVAVPPRRRRVRCEPGQSTFRLAVRSRPSTTPIAFLNEVTRLEASASGTTGGLSVNRGELTIGDDDQAIEGAPARVMIEGNDGASVEAKLESSAGPRVANLSLGSKRASMVTVEGADRVPSWLDRHGDLALLLLGLAGGAVAATVVDHLAKRRGVRP